MKNARLHNKTTRSRPDRGQNLEAEAKEKFWPTGHFGLEDLTSLFITRYWRWRDRAFASVVCRRLCGMYCG